MRKTLRQTNGSDFDKLGLQKDYILSKSRGRYRHNLEKLHIFLEIMGLLSVVWIGCKSHPFHPL
jgi:hypothetical protein